MRFSQVQAFETSKFSTFPPGWSWCRPHGTSQAVQGMSGESLRLCGALVASWREGTFIPGKFGDEKGWTLQKNKAFFFFLVSPSKLTKTNNFSWCNMARGNFHHLLDSVLCERSIWNWNASLGTREPSRDKQNLRDIWVVFYLCPWFCWEAQKIIYIHGMKFNHKFAFNARYEQPISSRSVSLMTLHKGVSEKTMVSFWIYIGTQEAGWWQMKI